MKLKMLCSALAGASLLLSACGGSDGSSAATPTKNVLFFLGDGMGITTMTAARIYSVGEDGELTMDKLPETAFVHTFSNDAQVTDSAPSMAAYMTGVKMNNEVISMSAETMAYAANGQQYINGEDTTCPAGNGQPAQTLLELSKAKGRAVGAISTTRVGHATPAATYAHICNRNGYNSIAEQSVPGHANYNARLGDGIDVLMGGGQRNYLPKSVNPSSKRTDTANLVDMMKAKGYAYVAKGSELAALDATKAPKLLGLFTQSEMAYELDRVKQRLDEPSLSDMTGKALDVLSRNDKGFFLMVEGGRIDHALHATNARRALQDTVAFDNAIQTALDKMAKLDPGLKNTLIVVTADHDHTLHLNGYAARTGKTEAGKPGVLGLVKNYVDGKASTDVDGNPYTILGFGNGPKRLATRGPIDAATLESPDYLQEAVVPLASETHGGGDVFLGAQGMGADTFSGVIDNTAVFNLIKKSIGLQ